MMKALVLESFGEGLTLKEIPVPNPGPGEVLLKMAASPVNPSDLSTLKGTYGQLRDLPFVPGNEGTGKIIEAGKGFYPGFLKGKRVACFADPQGQGLWSEYALTKAQYCIPLMAGTTYEQAACMLINPLTAWAFFDIVQKRKIRAIANTAAASALGKMIIRLGKKFGITVVNIVRKEAQVEALKELGAEHILNSSSGDFDQSLKNTFQKLGVQIAFDAVAGEMTDKLVQAIPYGGEVMVYGALSEESGIADPRTLIFGDKKISGFWLAPWLRRKNPLQIMRMTRIIQKNLGQYMSSEIAEILPIGKAENAPQQYEANMSAGKILIGLGADS